MKQAKQNSIARFKSFASLTRDRLLHGLIVLAALASCSMGSSVSDLVASEAAKSESFELRKLTSFERSQAFVFSPYSLREQVCGALPAAWERCASTYPAGVGEGNYLLAFVRDGMVVHHELHPRRNGEFCASGCLLQLTPQKAKFSVSSVASGPKWFSQIAP